MEWEINFGTVLWWICLIWFLNILFELTRSWLVVLKDIFLYVKKPFVFILYIVYKTLKLLINGIRYATSV